MNLEILAKQVVIILQNAGFEAYFVGGAVRDKLLGLEVSDIDIATSATVEKMQDLFEKTIPVGAKFGILIVVHQGHNFEVATFRQDQNYADGRHPGSILKATLEEDAKRRDFTINGLYLDPVSGKIFDFSEGRIDLANKLIKAIGAPKERFMEDHLRMIRAARYSASLDFQIEDSTQKAIIEMAPFVKEGLSIERIYQELDKMHAKSCLGKGLECLEKLSLLRYLFPHLDTLCPQELKRRCEKIKKLPSSAHLILALCLLFDIKTIDDLKNLVSYFKASNQALKIGTQSVMWLSHENFTSLDYAQALSDIHCQMCVEKQALIEKNPLEFLQTIECKKNRLKPVIELIKNNKLIIEAQDLISLGVPKGPKIKELLTEAMALFADNPTLSKASILKIIQALDS